MSTSTVDVEVLPKRADVTAALRDALAPGASAISPGRRVYFVWLDTDPPVRVHTDIGPREYLGETWLGVGSLGAIAAIPNGTDLSAPQIELSLSLVNNEAVQSMVMFGGYQGKPAEIHLGAIDRDSGDLLAAGLLWAGMIENTGIKRSDTDMLATVKLADQLVRWRSPPAGTYSHVDQVRRYPADKGLEHVLSLQGTVADWGDA